MRTEHKPPGGYWIKTRTPVTRTDRNLSADMQPAVFTANWRCEPSELEAGSKSMNIAVRRPKVCWDVDRENGVTGLSHLSLL